MQFRNLSKSRIDLLKDLPKNGVGAELGVFCGTFSWQILEFAKPRRLYLVDIFDGPVISGDENGENLKVINMASMRWKLEEDFSHQPVTVVRAESSKWLLDLDPGILDFVYIDTTHTLEQTTSELVAAQRAVKFDGYICGHDFSEQFPGVITAVERFCVTFGLCAEIYTGDKLASFKIKNIRRDGLRGFWREMPYASEN